MSKFYGQVEGMSSTTATRRGGKFIKTSAQSYDGSIQTRLEYDDQDNLMVEITMCESTGFYGDRVFRGTFEDLKGILAYGELYKLIADEMIDSRIEAYGVTDTVQWLYESGVSITRLVEVLHFDPNDVRAAVAELEGEAI